MPSSAKRILIVAISIMYWMAKRASGSLRHFLGIGGRSGCVVLYYHGVTEAQQSRFRRQMRYLRSRVKVVRTTEILHKPRTDWCVCITFDDGLDSVRRNAVPTLVECGIPATVFVVTGCLGRQAQWEMKPDCPEANEPLMTSRQLLALPESTIEIGSHTVSHPDLVALPASKALQELMGSRQYLEALLGEPVKMISLPFGRYTSTTMRLARQVGYEVVMTCDPQVACGANGGPKLGRFRVTPDDWTVEFRLKVAGAYGWLYHAQRLRRVLATALNKLLGARNAGSEGTGRGRPSDRGVPGSAVRTGGQVNL